MVFPEAGCPLAKVDFANDASIHALVAEVLQMAGPASSGPRGESDHPVSDTFPFVSI